MQHRQRLPGAWEGIGRGRIKEGSGWGIKGGKWMDMVVWSMEGMDSGGKWMDMVVWSMEGKDSGGKWTED